MITKKDWSEFRSTGLVTIINQILHIFGWSIVFEINIETDEIISVFPARVKFRGFDNQDTTEAYRKISKYMLENANELNNESNIEQK